MAPNQLSTPVSYGISTDASAVPDRWLLQVKGLAEVRIQDQDGRRIGPAGNSKYPNLVENQIPGASYSPGRFFSSAFLAQPGIYTFTFIAQAPHTMNVSLSLYSSVRKFDTFFFQGVPMMERSQARLIYNTADHSIVPVLALDPAQSGEIEQIQPTILNPQAADDIVPPTTQIDINENVVTLSAADNPGGAGVLRTYYTTDGITRSVYTESFPIPSDAKMIMAYSEDRAGNLEYPGAVLPVLGVSETDIVMRVITREQQAVEHIISVVNLDPLTVTGQLEWEASTDVTWLSVEPSAGTTPSSITLSVRSVDLAEEFPGAKPKGISGIIYETNVTVRSLTLGTVFAERTLHVRVETADAQQAQTE